MFKKTEIAMIVTVFSLLIVIVMQSSVFYDSKTIGQSLANVINGVTTHTNRSVGTNTQRDNVALTVTRQGQGTTLDLVLQARPTSVGNPSLGESILP
jgi:hypothetical protein